MSTTAEAIALDVDGELDVAPPPSKAKRKYDRSIIEGPLVRAVWKIAWPAILTNLISGVQGWVDQIMVGNLIGYKANAAIGASFQIFLLVITFVGSIFIGMSVLVARFAGAGDHEKVDRSVYQGFLTAIFISLFLIAPIGYFASPYLLTLVNAAPDVRAEALPFLRIMFTCSVGSLIYFMMSGVRRSAGDAKTPMVLGMTMTVANIILNVILIRGLGPIPAFGTAGSAMGTCIATGGVGIYSLWRLMRGGWVIGFPRGGYAPDWSVIRKLFKFGLPAGFQGVAMNFGGVLMYGFMGSLAARRGNPSRLRCRLRSVIPARNVVLERLDGCVGGSRRTKPWGWKAGPCECCCPCRRTDRDSRCRRSRIVLFLFPQAAARRCLE